MREEWIGGIHEWFPEIVHIGIQNINPHPFRGINRRHILVGTYYVVVNTIDATLSIKKRENSKKLTRYFLTLSRGWYDHIPYFALLGRDRISLPNPLLPYSLAYSALTLTLPLLGFIANPLSSMQ